MNRFEQYMAEYTYGPITRMPGKAWEWNFLAGQTLRKPVTTAVASMIRAKLLALLDSFKPDAILSAHPIFLASVLDVMGEAGLNIPLIAHEVDLVDITEYWYDPRIYRVLAPSREAYECTVAHVDDPERVIEVGFPVRSRFMGLAEKASKVKNKHTTVTIMSGSEGAGIVRVIARELLRKTDCDVNVICGSNERLRKKIRNSLGKQYHGRINPMGFVDNIQDVMCASDILIMRASPNSVMEAVALNKPVVLFGQLAGQELHNPEMMEKHGLAVICRDKDQMPQVIQRLRDNGGAEIQKMREAQKAYMPGDPAEDTAKLIYDYISDHVSAARP